MKSYFCEKEMTYDGSQLRHLYAYLNFKLLGDSVVSWVGPCSIPFANMADGEDYIAGAEIRGDRMLHFIVEKFDIDFFAGVSLQRLLASLCIDVIYRSLENTRMHDDAKNRHNVLAGQSTDRIIDLRRDGDDIYCGDKKLSISIAKKCVNSVIIHFAINIVNDGTPVPTFALSDLGLQPEPLAKKLMEAFITECHSISDATHKVFE